MSVISHIGGSVLDIGRSSNDLWHVRLSIGCIGVRGGWYESGGWCNIRGGWSNIRGGGWNNIGDDVGLSGEGWGDSDVSGVGWLNDRLLDFLNMGVRWHIGVHDLGGGGWNIWHVGGDWLLHDGRGNIRAS